MKGVLLLSWRHAWHHRKATLILTACIALSVFLPAATDVLIRDYQRDLMARAQGTPLLAGAKGNRFDLTLDALYFRASALEPIPASELDALGTAGDLAIPLHVRFTARGVPIVGTSPEYFELRGAAAAEGTLPMRLGDVVLGATVAERLGLSTGDALFSDQQELYDISRPPALKMRVSGVLAPCSTADDDAVFVDVKTAWVIEGISHGHDEAAAVDEALLIGRTEETVRVSRALIEYNEITPENIDSFHLHEARELLPLTAVIVVPRDDKAGTLIKARVNASAAYQIVVPTAVIDDLMAFVFRLKTVFDTFSTVLAVSTLLLVLLVVMLSMRLRAGEMRTLDHMGCSRFTVAKLYAAEIVLVCGVSLALAGAGVWAAGRWLPDLVRLV